MRVCWINDQRNLVCPVSRGKTFFYQSFRKKAPKPLALFINPDRFYLIASSVNRFEDRLG
jgi:hypothetical protein